jgi:hypothetical protein
MNSRNVWVASALLCSILVFSGCAIFLLGAGAAGGMAISKDTIEGVVEKPYDRVWNAGRDVLKQEGFIRLDNKGAGVMEAEVRKSQVTFEAQQITERTVRFRVKARKTAKILPDMDLANELYNKIFQKLK